MIYRSYIIIIFFIFLILILLKPSDTGFYFIDKFRKRNYKTSIQGFIFMNEIAKQVSSPSIKELNDYERTLTIRKESTITDTIDIKERLTCAILPWRLFHNEACENIEDFVYLSKLQLIRQNIQTVGCISYSDILYDVNGFTFRPAVVVINADLNDEQIYIEDIILPTYDTYRKCINNYELTLMASTICLLIAIYYQAHYYCVTCNNSDINSLSYNLQRFMQELGSLSILLARLEEYDYKLNNRFIISYKDVIDKIIDKYVIKNLRWVI